MTLTGFCVLFGSTLLATPPEPPPRLALLIGVSRYAVPAAYATLHSGNDLRLLRPALVRQGFPDAGITALEDSAATGAGILAALDSLVRRTSPRSVVVIHFSGHGQQLPDDNGDELDGYDEALVAFNAPADPDSATYDGHGHLRDDKLGAILGRLRAAAGPAGMVLISVDACFSGSITRNTRASRGVTPLGKPRFGGRRDSTDQSDWRSDLGPDGARGLAPFVVLSAARHNQLARETDYRPRQPGPIEGAGAYSLALSQALAAARPGSSHRALFDAVRAGVAETMPGQFPQAEGNLDTELLNGASLAQQPYVEVLGLSEDSLVVLRGGGLMGLLPGAEVGLYPRDTRDPGRAIASDSGVVERSESGAAFVRVTRPNDALTGTWAFVRRLAFGDRGIAVYLDKSAEALRPVLAGRRTVRLVDSELSAALAVLALDAAGRFALDRLEPSSRAMERIRLFEGDAGALQARLARYALRSYLDGLVHSTAGFAVSVRQRLAVARRDREGNVVGCDSLGVARARLAAFERLPSLAPGEVFYLMVRNLGSRPAFLSVLNLTSDGSVLPQWPEDEDAMSDGQLRPGAELVLPCFIAEPGPRGPEIFKVFLTRDRLRWNGILAPQPVTRSAPGPLEEILLQLVGPSFGTTRAPPVIPAGLGAVGSVSFYLSPP